MWVIKSNPEKALSSLILLFQGEAKRKTQKKKLKLILYIYIQALFVFAFKEATVFHLHLRSYNSRNTRFMQTEIYSNRT